HALTNTPPYYGKTAYEILMNLIQGKAKPPQAFNPNIPIDLENIILKAIQRNTAIRYKTAQEMAQDLKKYLDIYNLTEQKLELSYATNKIEPQKSINKKRRKIKKYLKKNKANQNTIRRYKIFTYTLFTLFAFFFFVLYFIFDSKKIHKAENNIITENTNQSIDNTPINTPEIKTTTNKAENNIITENTNQSIDNISTNTPEIKTQIENTSTDNLTTKKTPTNKNNQTTMDIYMEKLFQHLENNDQFQYLGTQTYTCGKHTNTMHEYKHIQTGMEFVLIPSGTYFNNFIRKDIFIRSFLIAKHECTQKIWNFIVPDIPKVLITKIPELPVGDEYPIVGQTYDDSYEFCKRTGLSLPSVNQWEYAARAGSKYRYCYGHDEKQLYKYAWYELNSNNSIQPVGQLCPNAFGLYDIHGNVSEQCADEYNFNIHEKYANIYYNIINYKFRIFLWHPRTDIFDGQDTDPCSRIFSLNDTPIKPPHILNKERHHVVKGGNFFHIASCQEFSCQYGLSSYVVSYDLGVRFIYSIFDKENTNQSIDNTPENTPEITTTEETPTDNLLTKKTPANKNNQTSMDIYMEKLFQHLKNNDQFQYLGTQTYTCGKHTNTMHEYKHIQTGMEFVLIPSGAYLSSSIKKYISIRSFLIAKHECTQKIWNLIVPDLPKRYISKIPELTVGDEYPIAGQTYRDSYEFCKRTGLSLPSINQWKYAAQAGSKYQYCYGNDEKQLYKYAWYELNSNNSTHPVGQRLPNAFGLYDIHGNVSEQCADEYNENNNNTSLFRSLNDIPTKPPYIPDTERRYVIRGGNFNNGASNQELSLIYNCSLSKSSSNVGVRFIYSIFDEENITQSIDNISINNIKHNIIAENTKQSIDNTPINNTEHNITSENTKQSIDNTPINNTEHNITSENTKQSIDNTPMDSYMKELFQHLENNDQFQYLETKTYTCGEHSNTMHEYKHIKTGMEFVLLPSGTYFNSFIRKDIFIRSFLIAKYECTQKIWNLIVPDLPKRYITDYPEFIIEIGIGDEYPIVGQTYADSYKFCKQTGLSLPSANQWEYAARAGSKYRYCYGHDEKQLKNYAWYEINSNESTHKVGQLLPNAFGLYDIHGNVSEQCADEYNFNVGKQYANTYYNIYNIRGDDPNFRIFLWHPRADVYDVQDADPCSRIFSWNDTPTNPPRIPDKERHHVFKGGNFSLEATVQEFSWKRGMASLSNPLVGVRFIYSIFDKESTNQSIDNTPTNNQEIKKQIEKAPTDNLTIKKTSTNSQTTMDPYMKELFQHLKNNDQFQYLGTQTYTCGEHTNTMHEYKHIQTEMEFVL
ncbi:MAG TPA: SUMF1/EgtB/PvdO family nonheme iron enzyme, partial [Planctomycetota bacterium]|nr:SUMF1/EgtB/PvdO family nonheme iron enzyme [Planctomycetota bacterium]